MALNPTFASASVNPSQSIGSDASAPAQGALPTGMNSQGLPIGDALPNGYNVIGQQNTGFSGLGGLDINYTAPQKPLVPMIPNFNQSYYQSPQYRNYQNNLNTTVGTDDYQMMPFGGFGSGNIANLQNQSYQDFLKNPSMGQPATQEVPDYKYVDPNPRINYFNDKNNFGGDLNAQIKAIDDAGQADPQYTAYLKKFYADADSYRNAPFTGEFRDIMPSPPQDYVSYLGGQDLINKQNSMPYQSQDNLFGQQGSSQGAMFRQEPTDPNYVQRNYTAQDVQTAMKNPEFDSNYYKNANVLDDQGNPLSMDAKQQLIQPFYNQQQQPNPALQPPTSMSQAMTQRDTTRPSDIARWKGWQDYAAQGGTQGWNDWSSLNYNQYEPQIDQPPPEQQPAPTQRNPLTPTATPTNLPTGWKSNPVNALFQGDLPGRIYRQADGSYLDESGKPADMNNYQIPRQPLATPTGTTPMATNPLSTYATTPTTGSTPAPTLNATPGSASSGSFGQGGVLPNVTTTQQQVTAAPSFYTDYLNQLATQGGRAAQDAQYVGAQPLQEQAFNLASQNVGNYQPTLQNAINLASSVGNTNLAQAIGDVGQANIARNLAPQATAGIVGSGQFGSKRGAQALGDVIANAELGLTAQQQQAMQQDMANRIAAAQQLGTLANSTQQLGLGDVNALSTLGQQQQTIGQNQQLFPMQQLANQSALLRGYTIPTSVSASQTGPGQQGQFQTSPLQQIMSVGTLLGALAKPGVDGTSAGGNLVGGLGNIINKISGKFAGSTGSSGSSSSVSPVTGLPIGIPGGSTYNKTDNTYVDTGGTKYIVNDDGTVTSYGGTEIPNPITYDEIFDTDPWLNNNYYNFDPDA